MVLRTPIRISRKFLGAAINRLEQRHLKNPIQHALKLFLQNIQHRQTIFT